MPLKSFLPALQLQQAWAFVGRACGARWTIPVMALLLALSCAGCDYLPQTSGGPNAGCVGMPGANATATTQATESAAPDASTPAPSPTGTAAGPTATGAGPTPTASAPCMPNHFIGGFSFEDADSASAAAQAGVRVAFTYGSAELSSSPLGTAFDQLGFRQVTGRPEVYLSQFECHRVFTLHLKSFPLSCSQDYPNMTESTMLSDIQQAVATDAKDPHVVGYWVLDDWPYTDTAQAAALLPQITSIIHTYAPGRLSICGFGASMTPNGTPWDDYTRAVLDSYTPQGCDLPAFYIYSQPMSDSSTPPSTFDWSMPRLLKDMLSDLRGHGWDRAQGFIGIGQGWAGTVGGSHPMYEIEPTAGDMATQAGAFCQAGAVGVVFYAWAAGGIGQLHTPANDSQMLAGVQQSAQSCQQIWDTSSLSQNSLGGHGGDR
jgi:hypothetical protein